MKRVSFGLAFFVITTGVFLLLQGGSDNGNLWSPDVLASEEDVSNPTLATCRAWIQANHSLEYSNHGCKEHADVLKSIKSVGGGVIPIGVNRFFIVWFPDDLDELPNKKMVVTLHGNGGCAEPLFQFWVEMSAQRKYAVAALQYAEEDSKGRLNFDDSPQIYENLRAMLGELQTHCPIYDIPLVLHGFSRGSARTFEIAIMDRADDGMKAFSAFISDSGTGFPETYGRTPQYLQNAAVDAYSGAHFWLYCGGRDHDGQTCDDMKRMRQLLLAHGGTVDDLYINPIGGHGIFITGKPGHPGRASKAPLYHYQYRRLLPGELGHPGQALKALFDYIDAIGNR